MPAQRPAPRTSSAGTASEQRSLLLQVLVCSVPAMVMLGLGQVRLSALAFYTPLLALLVYQALAGRPARAAVLVVGVTPLIMMMRVTFYHNSVVVIYAFTLAIWGVYSLPDIRLMLRNSLAFVMIVVAVSYWWISFLSTGVYSINLRVLDLLFSCCTVYLLGRYRSYLATALVGMTLVTVAMAVALGQSGYERLGLTFIGDFNIGHPTHIGIPATLTILACFADGGRWMFRTVSPRWRYVTAAGAAAMLMMTTSRTNWVMTIAGLAVLFALQPEIRRQVAAGVVIIVLAGGVVLLTSRGKAVEKYFGKAASSDRTLAQRTTGRAAQYAAFPRIFAAAPIRGHGAGSSSQVYQTLTGMALDMHSLVLHVGVEEGLVGLTVLFLFYLCFIVAGVRHRSRVGETLPLVASVCFMLDGLAHNSFSPLMGVFLGIGLLANHSADFYVVRPFASLYRRSQDVYGSRIPSTPPIQSSTQCSP